MKKYRIREIERYGGNKMYEVQKRLFGFLWWYNFLIDEDGVDASFVTQKEAEEAIEYARWKSKTRIVKTY